MYTYIRLETYTVKIHTKFAVIMAMLSGQKPGNKNSWVPRSWLDTLVVTRIPRVRYPFWALNTNTLCWRR